MENAMIKTVIYPVKDLEQAKARFAALLGVAPTADSPYYVGFDVDGQHIGLDPNGHQQGVTAYYHVGDIEASLRTLVDGGATTVQEIKEVGAGRRIAIVEDADGNVIGLLQD
jgi:predicted enzyme related to lactoylglutathione lyase